nr:general stress protein [Pseudofrankia sp. BMG5.36]
MAMGWREFLGLREPRRPHEQDYDHDDRGRDQSHDDRGYPEDHIPREEPAHEYEGGSQERGVRAEDGEYQDERAYLERGYQDELDYPAEFRHPEDRDVPDEREHREDYQAGAASPVSPGDVDRGDRVFRSGDVDESPDLTPTSRGSLNEARPAATGREQPTPTGPSAPAGDRAARAADTGAFRYEPSPPVGERTGQAAGARPLSGEPALTAEERVGSASDVESFLTTPAPAAGQRPPAGFEVFEAPVERLGDVGDVGGAGQADDQWPAGEEASAGRAGGLGQERGERLAVDRDRYQEFLAADAEREEAARAEANRPAGPAARPARPAPGAKPAGKRQETRSASGQSPAERRGARSAQDGGQEGDGQARLAVGGGDPGHTGWDDGPGWDDGDAGARGLAGAPGDQEPEPAAGRTFDAASADSASTSAASTSAASTSAASAGAGSLGAMPVGAMETERAGGAQAPAEPEAEADRARSAPGTKPGQELSWRFPPQQVVASYQTHDQAERAVDHLADARFPVERTAIVGRGLTSVETIGRMSWRDSTLRAVGGWAVAGALVGLVFGLLDWVTPLRAAFSLALWGLLFGALLGLFAGLLTWVFAGGSHQRVTHSHVYRAHSYDLLVDSELAERARSTLVLGGFPVTGSVRKDAISFRHR